MPWRIDARLTFGGASRARECQGMNSLAEEGGVRSRMRNRGPTVPAFCGLSRRAGALSALAAVAHQAPGSAMEWNLLAEDGDLACRRGAITTRCGNDRLRSTRQAPACDSRQWLDCEGRRRSVGWRGSNRRAAWGPGRRTRADGHSARDLGAWVT